MMQNTYKSVKFVDQSYIIIIYIIIIMSLAPGTGAWPSWRTANVCIYFKFLQNIVCNYIIPNFISHFYYYFRVQLLVGLMLCQFFAVLQLILHSGAFAVRCHNLQQTRFPYIFGVS